MKISTATSVLVNYPLSSAVEQVIEAGFDGVDLWAGRPHLFRNDLLPAEIVQIRDTMRAAHLAPVAVMPAFFRYPFSLSSPIEPIRADSIAYVEDCIENAIALDCCQVLIVPSHSLIGQSNEDARVRFADSLSRLAKRAETLGVRLGIEVLYPLLSDILCSSRQAMQFIQEIGSPNLGVVLDSGHLCLAGESLQDALEVVGESLLEVHVNDNDGRVQQNAIPGDGVIDFPALVQTLRSRGYTGYLTLELGWHYSFDPIPVLQQARQRVLGYLEPGAQG